MNYNNNDEFDMLDELEQLRDYFEQYLINKNLYTVIGCDSKSCQHTIRKAYLKAMLINHPDKHSGNLESSQNIVKSYKILSEYREIYDNQWTHETNKLLEIKKKFEQKKKKEEEKKRRRDKKDELKKKREEIRKRLEKMRCEAEEREKQEQIKKSEEEQIKKREEEQIKKREEEQIKKREEEQRMKEKEQHERACKSKTQNRAEEQKKIKIIFLQKQEQIRLNIIENKQISDDEELSDTFFKKKESLWCVCENGKKFIQSEPCRVCKEFFHLKCIPKSMQETDEDNNIEFTCFLCKKNKELVKKHLNGFKNRLPHRNKKINEMIGHYLKNDDIDYIVLSSDDESH